jgi:hypothetical protein
MLKIMRKILVLLMILAVFPLYGADVYVTYDEFGNPIFSDQPTEGAKKMEVEDVMTIPAFRGPPPSGPRPEPVQRYRQVTITSPKNDETYFRAEGDLVFSATIIPRLRPSDTVIYYMNGQEIYSGKSTSISLGEVDRGTHILVVAVKDGAGNEVKRSEPVTFHMRQASRLNVPN